MAAVALRTCGGSTVMTPSPLEELGRVDEPQAAQGYAEVLTRVAAAGKPLIVRRGGADFAAVVPLEQLERFREMLAREELEQKAAAIDWEKMPKTLRPPQSWFDDTDNPFEPEVEAAP